MICNSRYYANDDVDIEGNMETYGKSRLMVDPSDKNKQK
jgi:hypothetical protein